MARKKAFIGAAISLGTSIVGGLMSSAAKRRQQEEQQRQQEAVYRAKEGSNMASFYNQQHANDYDLSLENERLYTSSLFRGGGSVNLKRKRNGIQENDAIKVDKPEISSKDEERRRKEGFRRYQSKRNATLLGVKAIAQILDPTGVSSYPDIAANYVKEGGFGNSTINSLLTAIPLLGTAGKAVSVLTKGNRLRNRSGKVTGFLRDVNLYNNRKKFKPLVNDFIDNADDALKTGDLNKAKNSVKAAKNVSNRYNKIDNGAIPSIDKSQTIVRSILESEDVKNGYDAISTYKSGGSIHIKDSKKGTFTAAAKKRGQSVQGFASKVLANKDNYSPAMVKKAVFAHNAPKWKHRLGGIVNTLFRLGGGTKLRATKRATKQNLGLENANKVDVNAPTAYRRLATESSQPSRTILSSEDKVIQKALESAISTSPVKGVDDTRTTYKGGGEIKATSLTQSNDAIQTNKPIIQDGKRKYKRDRGSQQVYQVESIKKNKEKLFAENILSGVLGLVDPTGIANYSDVINSVRNGDDYGTIVSNVASALPVMGKVGRALKGLTKNKTINKLVRNSNRLDNKLNYVDKSIDNINDAAKNFNLREYSKSILDNTTAKDFDKLGIKNFNNATRNLEIFKKVENSPMNKYDDFISGIKSSAEVISTAQKEANKGYKIGGKADVNNIITEGGDAKRIGHQTFLLRGRKHRNGGIVLGKGRNSIEAEGGEVVKIDKNTMKILSTVPMANGESPANRVLKGESPNKVFDSQEQFKDRNNLNNNSYERLGFNRKDNSRSNGYSYMENGGTGNLHSSKSGSNININKTIKEDKMKRSRSSLLGRRKAALGDYLNLAGDAFNIISPLLGGSRTKRAINRMVAPTQPTQFQAANLRTTYNIQPQLTDVYNAEQQSIAETNRNTASSVAAQARGTRLRQLGLNQRNQLRGQQQNIETQLINQNRLNRQQVTNQNIAATNDWRDRVSQFVNDQIVSKANVDNQMIENVSAGIRDLQLRSDKNQQERNALTAIMASNPEQVNLFMKKRKEYENLLDRNSRSLLRPYRCGGSVKRKMKR